MISEESIARIEISSVWRARRVEVFDLPEGQVLVKGLRATRSPWPHRLLNTLAWMAGVPYLKAVPVRGEGESQATEVMRLRALGHAGLPVPEVLHVADDYFVMTYLGSRDMAVALREQGLLAWDLWLSAMELLLQVHARGQYLSQCFARNIIVSDGFHGLIDFEDDPLEVMTLVEAQARDWLAYLQSTLFSLRAEPEQLDAALRSVFGRESAPVRAVLHHAARRLGWLRWLPTNRKVWGKDFVSLQPVGAALHRHFYPRAHGAITGDS